MLAVEQQAAVDIAAPPALDAGVDHRGNEHQRVGDQHAVLHTGFRTQNGHERQGQQAPQQGAGQQQGEQDEHLRDARNVVGELFQEGVVPGTDALCHKLTDKAGWDRRPRGQALRISPPRRGGPPCRSRRTSGTGWRGRRTWRCRRGSCSRWRRGCSIPS